MRLAAHGRDVTVLDPNEPGSGASYGNAGTIANYALIPVGSPTVLKSLPQLLFGRDSPLSITRSALIPLMPWLLRFAYQSLPGNAARNAGVIAALLEQSLSGWIELASEAKADDLLSQNGCLYVYDTAKAASGAAADIALRKKVGIAQEIVSPDDVARLEPALPACDGGGFSQTP
ncbi:glycine/D-amino acid oxidase-like deaminating enzyme [Sinorhizobium fredii]